ncbi:IS3 family transposase, partial [Lactobacillus colini]|uniref:IS3 family transposase n=1 Tax=Lactobacillus colini TaxID=1819254 RepID=UPI001FD91C62
QWKFEGISITQISKNWKLNNRGIAYMINLIDRYGIGIYDQSNEVFSKEFKEDAIEKLLLGTKSLTELSLELGLRSNGMLSNWVREYKKNGYNVVIKKKGRRPSHEPKEVTQRTRKEDPAARRRKLKIAYCQCLRKKTKRLGSETTEEIAQAITELRQIFKVSLEYILETIAESPDLPQIAKSTYYYTISKPAKEDKHPELTQKIKEIFDHHKQRYGYRRVFLQLAREGWETTLKQVRLIMQRLGLKGRKRNKRKYSSYKGTIGKIAPNHIKRNFFAIRPNMKWYTDITEFHLNGEKLYLSPILDGCGGDIVAYSISRHPDMELVLSMLNKAFDKHKALNAL